VENININIIEVKESKPIIPKIILKRPKVGNKEEVKTETLKMDVNFR